MIQNYTQSDQYVMMKEYLQKYKKESFELDREDFLAYFKKIQSENEILKRGIKIQNQKWDNDKKELESLKHTVQVSDINRIQHALE